MTKYITKKELANEDWKTQLKRGYGNIPKGEEVTFIRKIKNLYGEYVLVNWDGNNYYVNEDDIIRK